MKIFKDSKGITFSTDIIITFFFLILVFGIIANIIDISSDRLVNSLETGEIERLTNEVVDILINSPGTPKNWEKLYDFGIVNPGLSIENNDENNLNKFYPNIISFKKIQILKNGEYENLITEKLFKNKIKSSITVYPINTNLNPIMIGIESKNFENSSNVISVNRTVKCDFYSYLAISSILIKDKINFESDLYSNQNYNNQKYYTPLCNHENIDKNNHSNSEKYLWICKGFKISKKEFEEKNYYIIFKESALNKDNYWILDNIKDHSNYENQINSEYVNLNNYLSKIFENESSMIFYMHSKINKNSLEDYEHVLVGIPKEEEKYIEKFKIDYFKEQECHFIMRSWYF